MLKAPGIPDAKGVPEAGRYEAVLDGRGLASGLYLAVAQVESGGEVNRSNAVRITLLR